ncbi:glycosyltransferase family 61 protein [Aeromicrobium ginsengisoli]|uniref:Glycosyltransferase family 61 protein n=1 Tax=Aeromicrobium ginsengisoli TaxID=363867 RepID=A0A5M4FA50_9ACTN|nr:glycosyltransferase 61 family protein [Aeromicrobium ginsengisoli]KAA1395245.1 glycosyltransferase family 61 protein [Aeromicrobium ginsengisoli]
MTLRSRLARAVRRRRLARALKDLDAIAEALTPAEGFLVVYLDEPKQHLVDDLARRLAVEVRMIRVDGSVEAALTALRSMPRPAAILDATSTGNRVNLLRQTVFALPAGAAYVAAGVTPQWTSDVRASAQPREGEGAAAARRRQELADSIDVQTSTQSLGVVRKRGTHHFTLRHHAVEEVLTDQFGADWGEVIAQREAYEYESRATLHMHGEPPHRDKPATISVPALSLRRYRDVTCHLREVTTKGNLVLPDTFRHWQGGRLFHKRIIPATAWFGRLEDRMQQANVRHEAGEFFSFDSAFPTHYGHLTTETLSKHWGWRIAHERNPDLRVVMTHQPNQERLPSWKADILGALGVPLDDILWVTQDESVRVDSLVAAMPQLENPHYADRDLVDTWEALYAGLGPDPAPHNRAAKIFLSRRTRTQRWCTNTPEVEAFMAEQGFTVIHAEDTSYAEQAHIFRAAKVIAGFAGSALFNMMLNPEARVVVLSSRGYVAANEYLFASAAGHEIHYFWAPPLVDQPADGFTVDAYRSDFTFNLDEHRAELIQALA